MKLLTKISESDNVAVALKKLWAGYFFEIAGETLYLREDIAPGHKVALKDIDVGQDVIKYGYPIGLAIKAIKAGELVHTHNVETKLSDILSYTYRPLITEQATVFTDECFRGYRRKNGEVGIRNELWIVPLVGCVNGIADLMLDELKKQVNIEKIDHIGVFKHSYGCSQLGDDLLNTRTILANIVKHPNAGGVLVLGLGCENNHLDYFREALEGIDENRIKFLVAQKVDDEITEGVKILKSLFDVMICDNRTNVPLSELRIGLKCGGSDGFSGLTANPLIGAFSDYHIGCGGTTVLTEVPEMFGAETILMERAVSEKVFQDIVKLINDFKAYFKAHNQSIYENPSPGNKEGGITTLEEKSLGCTQKGGISPVVDVLAYGEKLKKIGLNLLNSPGNDLVSVTALGAAGCHLALFSTGRGTPFGTFIPTLKISTNNELFASKPHWIDFNAGVLLDGKDKDILRKELSALISEVANGRKLKHEERNFREIAIFKSGVTV